MYSQKGNVLVVVLVLVIVVAAGGYASYKMFWSNQADDSKEAEHTMENDEIMSDDMMPNESGDGGMMGTDDDDSMMGGGVMDQTKEFMVSGSPFKFSVSEIRVKKGDTVRIVFTNEQGMHDWVVDAFSARTKVLQAGQTETIEFIADKIGTFEYYCSVGNHRQVGMKGNLIVE